MGHADESGQGKNVGMILSGGNIAIADLRGILNDAPHHRCAVENMEY